MSSKGATHECLVKIGFMEGESHRYTLMGTSKATYLHINNVKTNANSVIVPIDEIKEAIEDGCL